MMKKVIATLFLSLFTINIFVFAQETGEIDTLSLDEFIELACARDRVFEEILIENLKLNYKKKLELPADDIIASSKAEYVAFVKQDQKGRVEISFSDEAS